MKRFKHSLSHYKLVTCNMGELIPIGLIETLPGDTIQHSTSMLVRFSPLMAPVMHPIMVRCHHFFVPNRLVYSGWENFITGGPDGTGDPTYPFPTNAAPIPAVNGNILDYMGVPTANTIAAGALNLMPIRAYNKIYNEYYRDEDLCAEATQDDTSVKKISWEKDYFTAARPWSQKGPAVSIGLAGGRVPITFGNGVPGTPQAIQLTNFAGATGPGSLGINAAGHLYEETGQQEVCLAPNGTLHADISATAADVIDLRRAFAIQRYQEARAQYGSRYTEYLRYLGVRSSDARLQRPEYLGGGKQTVAFSEVLRTGNESAATSETAVIGEMKGHGISAMRSNRYRYFCEEHGFIITMLSVRPRSMYNDGLDRLWSRRTKEEYYQKELEMIGQQEVYNREVYLKGDGTDAGVFGYQDRYSEYRHMYSKITGEFRNVLDYWHLGRKFTDTPTLNASFVECAPTKRIFAEQTQHSLWIMCSHNIQARRMLGKRTIGRII